MIDETTTKLQECNHQVDPASVRWDPVGRVAVCVLCGERLFSRRFVMRPGDPAPPRRVTAKERREARRQATA